MLMRFRDIDHATLSPRDGGSVALSFHVGRPLRHFGVEYEPGRKGDMLSLELCNDADVINFRKVVGCVLR